MRVNTLPEERRQCFSLSTTLYVCFSAYRIFFVTWNVATKFPNPQQDLHQILGISSYAEPKQWPDLYFIGFVLCVLFFALSLGRFGSNNVHSCFFRLQEVKSQPQNMVLDYILFEDPWTRAFR